MSCTNCTRDHRCNQGDCPGRKPVAFHAGPGFAFVDTQALGGPKYRGPERRIPLDSPLLRRVLTGLLGFWVVVTLVGPALLNVWARWAA